MNFSFLRSSEECIRHRFCGAVVQSTTVAGADQASCHVTLARRNCMLTPAGEHEKKVKQINDPIVSFFLKQLE